MSTIDRQRIAAVKAIEALGYAFDGASWNAPDTPTSRTDNVSASGTCGPGYLATGDVTVR